MDVRCDRCQTEYEFDEALVSERGTSVKCTNCGFQFKVYRRSAATGPDVWAVRTRSGKAFDFRSLRELQRAIAQRDVTEDDSLTRNGATRRLSQIPELAPFFDEAKKRTVPPPRGPLPTPLGIGDTRPAAPVAEGSVVMQLASTRENRVPSMREILEADPPTVPIPADLEPATERKRELPARAPLPAPSRPPVARAPVPAVRASEPPSDPPLRERSFPPPSADDDDDEAPRKSSRKSSGLGVAVGVFVVAVVAAGGLVGAKLLLDDRNATAAASASAAATGKVGDLLKEGEAALLANDLETAKERFIKASALAETDKRVLLGLARLANAQADVSWLRFRALPEDADGRPLAKAELDAAAKRAVAAAEKAFAAGPEDVAAAAAKVDALRISGDVKGAKALASRLSSEGEAGYVTAALDLLDDAPAMTFVVTRLKAAAARETSPGRARALLALALFRSGDKDAAKAEVDALAKAAHPYPALRELRALVAGPRAAGSASASASAAPSAAPGKPVDIAALPTVAAGGGAAPPAAPANPGAPSGGGKDDGGDYSEEELQRRLFGDHKPPAKKDEPKKDEPKKDEPKKEDPKKPHIDTSDLPGVKP